MDAPAPDHHEHDAKKISKIKEEVARQLCGRRMHRAVRDIYRDKGSVSGTRQANGEENEQ